MLQDSTPNPISYLGQLELPLFLSFASTVSLQDDSIRITWCSDLSLKSERNPNKQVTYQEPLSAHEQLQFPRAALRVCSLHQGCEGLSTWLGWTNGSVFHESYRVSSVHTQAVLYL